MYISLLNKHPNIDTKDRLKFLKNNTISLKSITALKSIIVCILIYYLFFPLLLYILFFCVSFLYSNTSSLKSEIWLNKLSIFIFVFENSIFVWSNSVWPSLTLWLAKHKFVWFSVIFVSLFWFDFHILIFLLLILYFLP